MNTLKVPPLVTEIDPAVMRTVHDIVEKEFEPEESWHDGGVDWLRDGMNDTDLHDALEPITEHVIRDSGKVPYVIRYSISIGAVGPGAAQNSEGWHIDGRFAPESYMVASVLPTEFLVRAPGLEGLRHTFDQHRYRRSVQASFDLPEDIEPASIGMRIFTPQAFDLIHTTKHIHRSPLNKSAEPIDRTWIRAILLSKSLLKSF